MAKMFNLLVLCTMLSLTFAEPAELHQLLSAGAPVPLLNSALVAAPTQVQVHEATLAKLGDVVEDVPTAVSHQSSTIVHSRAQRVTPIVAPAVRSYSAPALTTYPGAVFPLMHSTPLLRAAALPVGLSRAAAFLHSHAAFQFRSYAVPLYGGYAGYSYGSPFIYTAPSVFGK